ncbi:MAG: DUF4911 domain-containing protein [Synergistaceae bacterium]|jgi:hypothetical protein|nr:DUF4911 domain-containing protein [Synergistaceae bacterium]
MVRYALKVPKEEVFYMSWTIDAYEGVAFLRNEAEPGVVSVICSQDYASEAESIIEAFELEGIPIERLGGAGATSDAGV